MMENYKTQLYNTFISVGMLLSTIAFAIFSSSIIHCILFTLRITALPRYVLPQITPLFSYTMAISYTYT